jgi:lipopolysaccharide biosynthesis protein
MEINNGDGKIKVIAYYLPQFYPCEFNDKWYGKGFTEWTNVGKAKPLFPGHYQPRVPADLGYYDLRIPVIAEQQAELAREAGVFGFCYWHYWWGEGEKLLNMPAERMLNSGKPDFPFCFGWDNGNWYKKKWDKDKSKDELIMEMKYLGDQDIIDHFYYCMPFFKDVRYLRYDNHPLFQIYNPLMMPDVNHFMSLWNKLLKENNISDSFYFIGVAKKNCEYGILKNLGMTAITFGMGCRTGEDLSNFWALQMKRVKLHAWEIFHFPYVMDYKRVIRYIWDDKYDNNEDVLPMIIPNWDHTPRSGGRDRIFVNSTPENWGRLVLKVFSKVNIKTNKVVMLKSWNEWGEGNYMEPDLKHGKGYIKELRKVLSSL